MRRCRFSSRRDKKKEWIFAVSTLMLSQMHESGRFVSFFFLKHTHSVNVGARSHHRTCKIPGHQIVGFFRTFACTTSKKERKKRRKAGPRFSTYHRTSFTLSIGFRRLYDDTKAFSTSYSSSYFIVGGRHFPIGGLFRYSLFSSCYGQQKEKFVLYY